MLDTNVSHENQMIPRILHYKQLKIDILTKYVLKKLYLTISTGVPIKSYIDISIQDLP